MTFEKRVREVAGVAVAVLEAIRLVLVAVRRLVVTATVLLSAVSVLLVVATR